MIEYTVDDGRAHSGPYRLLTTILGVDQAPATELVAAYAQCSKSPALVFQKIWGHL